jgi:hypothetical protein
MEFRTPITDLLGIRHPILLAPMGAVSGGALAAAVSGAGGLGLLGPGYDDEAWIEREFAAADGVPIGIGFITWYLARHPSGCGQRSPISPWRSCSRLVTRRRSCPGFAMPERS